jgi:hypothetical protein
LKNRIGNQGEAGDPKESALDGSVHGSLRRDPFTGHDPGNGWGSIQADFDRFGRPKGEAVRRAVRNLRRLGYEMRGNRRLAWANRRSMPKLLTMGPA